MRLRKSYELASFKALPGEEEGAFEAVVSIFGNVDLQGDRVLPGAFTKSLGAWRQAGDPIPVIWSHDWADPFAHIGFVDPNSAEEIPPGAKAGGLANGGLLVRGKLDVEKPFARQVYDLMKQRRVKEFSFAYDVVTERKAEDDANELVELDIIEVGPTLKGANPDTVSLSVKAAADMDKVKAELANAALTQTVKSDMFAKAMAIDPDIAKMLGEFQAPTLEEDVYHIVGRIEFTGEKYDLEQPEKFVCTRNGVECRMLHDTKAEAEAHIAMRKSEVLGEAKADDEDDKAEGKPWHIEEEDGKFCVVKTDDGETVACHDTREEAEAQMRALYASENDDDADGEKHTSAVVMTVPEARKLLGLPVLEDEPPFTITSNGEVTTTRIDDKTYEVTIAPKAEEADGEKAGRVLGRRRLAELQQHMSDAVARWADEVNGELEEEGVEGTDDDAAAEDEGDGEKAAADDEIANLKAQLDALMTDKE